VTSRVPKLQRLSARAGCLRRADHSDKLSSLGVGEREGSAERRAEGQPYRPLAVPGLAGDDQSGCFPIGGVHRDLGTIGLVRRGSHQAHAVGQRTRAVGVGGVHQATNTPCAVQVTATVPGG